jgi:putative ABC transport system substrate-binding protein
MKRRDFITLLGGAAAAWPFVAGAQQPAMPVIGGLYGVSEAQWRGAMAGFRRGLGGRGWAMVCTADAARTPIRNPLTARQTW